MTVTIVRSRSRLKVNYAGDGNPGPRHVGWGPLPMMRMPVWVVRLAIRRIKALAIKE